MPVPISQEITDQTLNLLSGRLDPAQTEPVRLVICGGAALIAMNLRRRTTRKPFLWSEGLKEKHLVIACAQCNSSRGKKRLADWFASSYCLTKHINAKTVAPKVRAYLLTAAARR